MEKKEMPQKYPQWSGAGAKREGTGLPIPSQKVLVYAVSISRSTASAGPQRPCRGGPQLDTAHKNIGKISLFLSENTRFPSISL